MPAQTFEPNVSYRTHLVGFLVGMGSGLIQYAVYRSVYLAAEVHEWVVEEPDLDFEAAQERARGEFTPIRPPATAYIHAFDADLATGNDSDEQDVAALGPASRRSH